MSRFANHANLDKAGIIRLEQFGAYVVIANRRLYEKGRASRFAVANATEAWVDSVFSDFGEARSLSEKLHRH